MQQVLGNPPTNFHPLPFQPRPNVPPARADAPVAVVWFRGHDLRVIDNVALDAAIACGSRVVALYVLERGAETDGITSYGRRLARTYPPSSPTSSPDHPPHTYNDRNYTKNFSFTSDIDNAKSRDGWGPLSPNGGFALGRVQRWYLHHSLRVLEQQLQNLGITLILRRVDSAENTAMHVVSVAKALGAGYVLWNKRYKPRAYLLDEDVRSRLVTANIIPQDFDSETLMVPNVSTCGVYNDFQSYTRFWMHTMQANPPYRATKPIDSKLVRSVHRRYIKEKLKFCATQPPCSSISTKCVNKGLPKVDDLDLLQGLSVEGGDSPGDIRDVGCVAAVRTLNTFLTTERLHQFASPSSRRDGMVYGKNLATSRLSPHVRFGEISPRVLFYSVVEAGARAKAENDLLALSATRTFLKNMSLREFGYYMLTRYPSAACEPIIPEFEVFPWKRDGDGAILRSWESGRTGFPIVDAAMRQLLREGWLHNRMRFLVASYFCKYLMLPWPFGAAHMVRTLVDGDEACNSLGWQWTMGCNSDSFPFSTLVNPLSLCTHSLSVKRAAIYIKKYVPELSNLPDKLVFTPWKATLEQQAQYNLQIIPFADYNKIAYGGSYLLNGRSSIQNFYPMRVVTGKEARARTRNAMEVMRRIFSAQKQCRTVIVDQTKPYKVCNNGAIAVLDIAHLDDRVSYVSDVSTSNKKSRSRGEDSGNVESYPRKRRRTSLLAMPTQDIETLEKTSNDKVSVSELASLSSDRDLQFVDRNVTISSGNGGGSSILSRQGLDETRAVINNMVDNGLDMCPSTPIVQKAKRPRASSTVVPHAADERLSVENLLSPTLNDPGVQSTHSYQHTHSRVAGGEMRFQMSGLPNLAQVASYQQPSPARVEGLNLRPKPELQTGHMVSYPPATLGTGGNMHNMGGVYPLPGHRGSNSVQGHGGVHPPVDMNSSLFGSIAANNSLKQLAFPPFPGVHHVGSTGKLGKVGEPGLPQQQGFFGGGNDSARRSSVVSGQVVDQKDRHAHALSAIEMQRTASQSAAMYYPVPAMPMMGSHFQARPGQHQNAHMMYPHVNSGVGVPHMNHGSQVGNVADSQGYYNGQQNSTQPVVWYPAIPPYMELHGGGMQGAGVGPMMVPMTRGHPGGMGIGYAMGGNNGVGSCADHMNGSIGGGGSGGINAQGKECKNMGRRGPSSPLERKEIVQRMAAMDYQDEKYGGKHSEHWQAISIHLLNLYEFTEDTERQNNRAYVRLCVLKDELRDANPNGPRVTVNHCKEVFRILNLPVTGEWDRRGHGGVRGPYVYGCVKKNEGQGGKR